MLPDRVSNPGPLTYESGALPIALRGPAHTYFGPYHTLVLFLSPHLLLQCLVQGFETCNIVQTCIGHVHKGNKILIQDIIAELYLLNDIIISTVSHCSTVHVSTAPSYSI